MSFFLKWFRRFGSLRVTVTLLAAVAVLLFWGTLYQSRVGVDAGTARFFGSWLVWVMGVIPVPALKTVMVLCFGNLLSSLIFRIPRRWGSLGLYLIHGGLLFLIAGSFAAAAFRETYDAYVLNGGEASGRNVLREVAEPDFYEIELGDTLSHPIDAWAPGSFSLGDYDFQIVDICENAVFDIVEDSTESLPKNRIGFPARMRCVAPEENSRPGVSLVARHRGWKQEESVLLSIMDRTPFVLNDGEPLRLSVRRERLPFTLKVLSSDTVGANVLVSAGGTEFPRRIALNAPLRLSPYAVYFEGLTPVTPDFVLVRFQVRRDAFSFVPYVFSVIVMVGLGLHFGAMLFRRKGRVS